MSFYAVFRTDLGTATARPVTEMREGTDADRLSQALEANEGAVMVAEPYALPDEGAPTIEQRWSRTVNPATGVVTNALVARRAEVVAGLLATRKLNLIRAQLEVFRLDRPASDATLAAAVTRIAAIQAMASLTDPDPAAIAEADDADGFRLIDRLYRRGNAVGAVSRNTFGRVTGALIEEGTNANGAYVRLAGGLLGSVQVCWTQITSSAAADSTWTYPAAFSVGPAVLLCPLEDSATARSAKVRNRTASAASVVALSVASARVAVDVMLVAVGRWPQA